MPRRSHIINGFNLMHMIESRRDGRDGDGKERMETARETWRALTQRQRDVYNLEAESLTSFHSYRAEVIRHCIKSGCYDAKYKEDFRKNPSDFLNDEWMCMDCQLKLEEMSSVLEDGDLPVWIVPISSFDDENAKKILAAAEARTSVEVNATDLSFTFDFSSAPTATKGDATDDKAHKKRKRQAVPEDKKKAGACSKCRYRGCTRCEHKVAAAKVALAAKAAAEAVVVVADAVMCVSGMASPPAGSSVAGDKVDGEMMDSDDDQ